MRIPREIIQSVKDRSDIVDLIGSYVTLKRAGTRYTGLCPFHSEKTPSFMVFPEDQHFFCFGCEAGGDVFTFVMRVENLEYTEAIDFLARRAGIEIPSYGDDENPLQTMSRKRVFEMNLAAAKFFRACLFDPQIGIVGMKYLKETRGLNEAFIKHFGIGYAPASSSMLKDYLKKQGFSEAEMKEGFLVGRGDDGRYFDYFRNRVMFPVFDTTGNVVAFSGRDVSGNARAKYLNSSDTPGFQKRRNLFALNFAKNYCSEQLILCEGNMDVVSLHAAGFQNAVASLGTALTDEQARIIAKYTKQVVISYDADEAGQRAANRAMGIFAKVGVDVRVLHMTGAKDPDEYIKSFGAEAFAKLLKQSATGFEFKLNSVLMKHDINAPEEKILAAKELCQAISAVYSNAEREVYIQAASDRIGIPVDILRLDVNRMIKEREKERQQQITRQATVSARALNDKINPEAAGSVQAAAAENNIIGLLLLYGEHRQAVRNGQVSLTSDSFVTSFNRRAFEAIMALEESDGGYDFSLLGEFFNPDEMGRLAKLEQARRSLSENGSAVLRATVEALDAARSRKEIKDADPLDAIARLMAEKKKKKQQV